MLFKPVQIALLLVFFVSWISFYTLYPTKKDTCDAKCVVLKCTPLTTLCLYTLVSNGLSSTYSKKIFLGLAFSAIGDGLLEFPR